MEYIIYDMEFMVTQSRQHLSDIIEIGAIKLCESEEGLAMTDLFHTYVQPMQQLTPRTTAFTGIGPEQLRHAPDFPQAAEGFKWWLGDPDTYFLCSWGSDDLVQLLRHCETHRVPPGWIRNHNDLQRLYTNVTPELEGRRVALKKALTANDIAFFGKAHRALDDAFNTAKLFRKLYPKLTLERNRPSEEQSYATKVVYSTAAADVAEPGEGNPFGKIAALLGMAM